MAPGLFHDFYKSDLQSVYALCVVPFLFLAWLLLSRRARASVRSDKAWRRFLYAYSVGFALETILDPIVTGPVTQWLGAGDSPLGTAILLTFVLLGDFRVYLLIFFMAHLARPERPPVRALVESAAWTFVVPIFAYAVDTALHHARPDLPGETIWLVYELSFLGVAIWLCTSGIPRRFHRRDRVLRRRIQAVAGYAAVYYALWAAADVLIMAFALDVGWALRVIPNQLYYSMYLPFVYFQLTSRR